MPHDVIAQSLYRVWSRNGREGFSDIPHDVITQWLYRVWSRNGQEGCSDMLHDVITQWLYRVWSRNGQEGVLTNYMTSSRKWSAVRSGAEERRFWGARLDFLIFRLRSYHVLILYSAECSGPKFHKTLMFLGQAGTFLSFQARCSSAKRSSTSDLTVLYSRLMKHVDKRDWVSTSLFFSRMSAEVEQNQYRIDEFHNLVTMETSTIGWPP